MEDQVDFFREIFENTTIGILFYDEKGKLIKANQSALKIMGSPGVKELSHLHLFDNPEISSRKDELLKKSFINFKTVLDFDDAKSHYKTNKTGKVYIKFDVSLFHNGYLVQTEDITEYENIIDELKKSKKNIKDSEERFKSVLDNTRDVLVRLNLQTGRYEYFSKSVKELSGYTSEEALKMAVEDSMDQIHPDDLKVLEKAERISRKHGRAEAEYRHRTKNGGYTWVSNLMSTVNDSSGNPLYQYFSLRDINEQKKAAKHKEKMLEREKYFTEELQAANKELMNVQDRLKKTIRKLEISNTELEQFAYVASHDLQEPLRMVTSFTQLLEMRYRNKLDKDADEYMGFVTDGAKRMKDLIDDLLIFSRINTAEMQYKHADINKVFDNVVNNIQTMIKSNQAKVTRETLPIISCDPSQINQLFQNLISNAIKFRSRKTPKIHVTVEQLEDEWKFSVCDNGIGIDDEHQQNIFKIFNRLHTREEYEGTGIGLSICKRIVERHGGKIWVESKQNEGSTFYFTLAK